MPGVYGLGEYDLAGFCVGAVERGSLLPRLADVTEGDLLIGVASSGIHSNGFSLVRKVLEKAGLSYSRPAPFGEAGQTVGESPRRRSVKHNDMVDSRDGQRLGALRFKHLLRRISRNKMNISVSECQTKPGFLDSRRRLADADQDLQPPAAAGPPRRRREGLRSHHGGRPPGEHPAGAAPGPGRRPR